MKNNEIFTKFCRVRGRTKSDRKDFRRMEKEIGVDEEIIIPIQERRLDSNEKICGKRIQIVVLLSVLVSIS